MSGSVEASVAPSASETLDSICGGDVQVLQRRKGYRFNLDPILLAHFAREGMTGIGPRRIVDLGTGSGIIPLILARKLGERHIVGLELQPSLYDLAERNVHLNRAENEISLVLGDVRCVRQLLPRGSFTHVIANPPYRSLGSGRISPESEKAIARHQIHCEPSDIAKAARHLLVDRGSISVVYPAALFSEVIAAFSRCHLQPRRIRWVHPRAHRPANRVLLEAIKSGRTPAETAWPLVLHDEEGYSPEVRAMID